MTFSERQNLLKRMDHFIRRKATGPPKEFSKKLGIPRTNLYRRFEDLESLGATIRYDKDRRSYFYEEGVEPGLVE